jgi:hypothetical protein
MAAAKRKAPATTASAATDSTARLEHIPITHHDVTMALSKAQAALELLHVAEEDYAGEELAWMRMICIDVVGEELEHAKVTYAKAVGDKAAVAS